MSCQEKFIINVTDCGLSNIILGIIGYLLKGGKSVCRLPNDPSFPIEKLIFHKCDLEYSDKIDEGSVLYDLSKSINLGFLRNPSVLKYMRDTLFFPETLTTPKSFDYGFCFRLSKSNWTYNCQKEGQNKHIFMNKIAVKKMLDMIESLQDKSVFVCSNNQDIIAYISQRYPKITHLQANDLTMTRNHPNHLKQFYYLSRCKTVVHGVRTLGTEGEITSTFACTAAFYGNNNPRIIGIDNNGLAHPNFGNDNTYYW